VDWSTELTYLFDVVLTTYTYIQSVIVSDAHTVLLQVFDVVIVFCVQKNNVYIVPLTTMIEVEDTKPIIIEVEDSPVKFIGVHFTFNMICNV
jgi:hypothetical protein